MPVRPVSPLWAALRALQLRGGALQRGAVRWGSAAAELHCRAGALQWGGAQQRRAGRALGFPRWGALAAGLGRGSCEAADATAHSTAWATAAATDGPGPETLQPAAPAFGGPSCPMGASKTPSDSPEVWDSGASLGPPRPQHQCHELHRLNHDETAGLQPPTAPSPSHDGFLGEGRAAAATRVLPMNREENRALAGLGAAHTGCSHAWHLVGSRRRGVESSSLAPPPAPECHRPPALAGFSLARVGRGSRDSVPHLSRGCPPGRGTEGAGIEVGGGVPV